MQKREFTNLEDIRLLSRGNKILSDLFSTSVHSIRQLTDSDSSAKGFYRFLQNDRVSEEAIIENILINCQSACRGKYVVCLHDTTEIDLSSHQKRIKRIVISAPPMPRARKGLDFPFIRVLSLMPLAVFLTVIQM
ncbi:transposase DNA-binding-containing protein [Pedobacter arcticus]|uniref:transposase DNA-binding-containing protein n=1 Tax=Pedobacter arcticus TaxID=752140 RepID=UPI000379DD83